MSSVGTRNTKQHVDRRRTPFPYSDPPPQCGAYPDLFQTDADSTVPGHDVAQRIRQAKSVCMACPIAEACLKWALVNEELAHTGIWGATTARERQLIRSRLVERHGAGWSDILIRESQPSALGAERKQHPLSASASARSRVEPA